MTLIDTLAATVDEHAEGWMDRGIDRVADLVGDRLADLAAEPGPDPERHSEERAALALALQGLNALDEHKAALAHLGRARLAGTLAYLGVGRNAEARRLFLAGGASFAERRAASAASTAATHEAAEAREAAWREVEQMANDVGQLALRALFPLLLAAL